MPGKPVKIGILALQGDYEAHRKVLEERLGVKTILVRTADEIRSVDGLILPGGESTTMGKLLDRFDLGASIRERAGSGMPVFGTCAGLILLAKRIEDSDQPRLDLLDITVARNAFGRQLDSFEADIEIPALTGGAVRGVFIRAPFVRSAGPNVEVLATYGEQIVAVRQDRVIGIAFHPELTDDTRMHEAFVDMVRASSASPSLRQADSPE